jgi:hypothetical protein
MGSELGDSVIDVTRLAGETEESTRMMIVEALSRRARLVHEFPRVIFQHVKMGPGQYDVADAGQERATLC